MTAPDTPEIMRTEIARLTAERDALRAAIFGGASYASDLRNGNFVEMAQTLHAAQKGGLARAEKAEAALATARAETAKWHADANLMLGFAELAYEAGAMPSSSELIAARDRALAADRKAVRERALRDGYCLGFAHSAEGYNYEYPFNNNGTKPEHDAEWVADRERAILALIEKEG